MKNRTVVPFGDVFLVFSDDANGRRLALGADRFASRPDSIGKYVEVVGQLATSKRDVKTLIAKLQDIADELPD